MILVHVLTADEQQAAEISNMLVEERLIVEAFISKGIRQRRDETGKVVSESQVLVQGKTKALLFATIDKLLKEKYGSQLPSLYSIPIVNMDWEQSAELKEKTKKV